MAVSLLSLGLPFAIMGHLGGRRLPVDLVRLRRRLPHRGGILIPSETLGVRARGGLESRAPRPLRLVPPRQRLEPRGLRILAVDVRAPCAHPGRHLLHPLAPEREDRPRAEAVPREPPLHWRTPDPP